MHEPDIPIDTPLSGSTDSAATTPPPPAAASTRDNDPIHCSAPVASLPVSPLEEQPDSNTTTTPNTVTTAEDRLLSPDKDNATYLCPALPESTPEHDPVKVVLDALVNTCDNASLLDDKEVASDTLDLHYYTTTTSTTTTDDNDDDCDNFCDSIPDILDLEPLVVVTSDSRKVCSPSYPSPPPIPYPPYPSPPVHHTSRDAIPTTLTDVYSEHASNDDDDVCSRLTDLSLTDLDTSYSHTTDDPLLYHIPPYDPHSSSSELFNSPSRHSILTPISLLSDPSRLSDLESSAIRGKLKSLSIDPDRECLIDSTVTNSIAAIGNRAPSSHCYDSQNEVTFHQSVSPSSSRSFHSPPLPLSSPNILDNINPTSPFLLSSSPDDIIYSNALECGSSLLHKPPFQIDHSICLKSSSDHITPDPVDYDSPSNTSLCENEYSSSDSTIDLSSVTPLISSPIPDFPTNKSICEDKNCKTGSNIGLTPVTHPLPSPIPDSPSREYISEKSPDNISDTSSFVRSNTVTPPLPSPIPDSPSREYISEKSPANNSNRGSIVSVNTATPPLNQFLHYSPTREYISEESTDSSSYNGSIIDLTSITPPITPSLPYTPTVEYISEDDSDSNSNTSSFVRQTPITPPITTSLPYSPTSEYTSEESLDINSNTGSYIRLTSITPPLPPSTSPPVTTPSESLRAISISTTDSSVRYSLESLKSDSFPTEDSSPLSSPYLVSKAPRYTAINQLIPRYLKSSTSSSSSNISPPPLPVKPSPTTPPPVPHSPSSSTSPAHSADTSSSSSPPSQLRTKSDDDLISSQSSPSPNSSNSDRSSYASHTSGDNSSSSYSCSSGSSGTTTTTSATSSSSESSSASTCSITSPPPPTPTTPTSGMSFTSYSASSTATYHKPLKSSPFSFDVSSTSYVPHFKPLVIPSRRPVKTGYDSPTIKTKCEAPTPVVTGQNARKPALPIRYKPPIKVFLLLYLYISILIIIL